jgi:hypothetical protein
VEVGLLTSVFSASLSLFEPGSLPARLIHNELIYVCGAAIPIAVGLTVILTRNQGHEGS